MGKINDFGFPFTSVAGDRQYAAGEWRDYFGKLIKNGVIQNDGNEVTVIQQAVANKTVSVGTGSIFINGVMFINDTAKTLSITDNASGNPRKDRIVARLNYTDRKIEFGVLVGTPGGSPVAPTLTRNTTVYELGIADITLANGFSTIVTANILDTRSNVALCGFSSMASVSTAEAVILGAANTTTYGVANVDEALANIAGIKKIVSLRNSAAVSGIGKLLAFNTIDINNGFTVNLATHPTRLTIPSGVTKILLSAVVACRNATGSIGALSLTVYKNGLADSTMPVLTMPPVTSTGTEQITSFTIARVVNVSANDYIELYGYFSAIRSFVFDANCSISATMLI